MTRASRIHRLAVSASRHGRHAFPAVAAVCAAALALALLVPAPAHAADLFPVDDWIGDGLKKTGEVVLGPLKLGAEQIAKLLAAVVGALADLLIPKSLVRAGVDGIAWLVQLPPVGATLTPSNGGYALTVRMPHVAELRSTLTWIGITLLPLGLVLAGGRALLAPSLYGDSPTEILLRVIAAGIGLVVYDWAWAVLTHLSHLLTSSLLKLPWVADGIERMLEALVIGGTSGAVVAAEFVIPLLIALAGAALLALLLLRVALEVGSALLYVLGGLLLGLSPTEFGRRLLTGWLIAATAMLLLPLLWTIVFVCGAAIMLDAGTATGKGGLAEFVAQLYNVAAAMATFGIAIKLAQGVMRRAHSGIGALGAAGPLPGGGRGPGGGTPTPALTAKTQQSLATFSQGIRGRIGSAAAAGGRAVTFPARHPTRAAQAISYPARRPVQATREAADGLRDAFANAHTRGAAMADTARSNANRRYEFELHGGRFSSRNADQRRETATAARDRAPAAPRAATSSGSGQPSPAPPPTARRALPPQPQGSRPSTQPAPGVSPPPEPKPARPGRSPATSSPRPPLNAGDPPVSLPLTPGRRRRRRDRDRDEKGQS